MDWRYRLLWIDSLAGLAVGLAVLVVGAWLDEWYQLPQAFVFFMAAVNLCYGSFSGSLALRKKRSMRLIVLLVVANLSWAILCVFWVMLFSQTANFFGLAHLCLEALFVGGLALLEWRWRELLAIGSNV